MQAELFIDDLDDSWPQEQRRLAACMLIGTAIVFLVLALFEWPLPSPLVPRLPPVLEVTLERPADVRRPEAPASRADAEPVQPPTPPSDARAPAMPAATTGVEPADPHPEVATPAASSPPVDWYAELERVAKEVGARAAREPHSMHPEFEELRRIARLRYGAPRTNPPPPAWQAEKDPYGRTLLENGNFYRVLEDMRLFNQEAFETFERHMIFVSIPLGRARPKNLPWVGAIRARYEYLREPDELPPLKATPDAIPPD